MRRYTDFFVMLAVLVLDFLVAVIMWNASSGVATDPNSLTLSYSVMRLALIAIPGIGLAAGLAFGRATWNLPPRSFYLVVFTGASLSAALVWVAALVLKGAGQIMSLENAVFSTVVLAVSSLIGLILGLTGAVPTVAKVSGKLEPKPGTNSSEKTSDVADSTGTADFSASNANETAPARMPTPGTAASANPRAVVKGEQRPSSEVE